jgi:putative transposase
LPEYRRFKSAGGTFFFTVVTYQRLPLLTTDEARAILHAAWVDVNQRYPFTTEAICLLPDHIHCIWSLPAGDANYSLRWGEIKKLFTKAYHKRFGVQENRSSSRKIRGEAALWQRRFWEHTIKDQDDYNRHVEYIHFNPVKHGLVENAADWPWSSFRRFVNQGYYDLGWGTAVGNTFENMNCGE